MILIIGGNGYVGKAFQRHLMERNESFKVLSRTEVDYYHVGTLIEVIRQAKPSFIINAAGYTGKPNVDACEQHKHDCLLGNAVLPGIIREACEATQTSWGHISSGCIYTGKRPDGQGFNETDPPNFCFRTGPSSFYSGTKALGEEVLDDARNCYIWRLRIPFDHRDGPRNYLTKLQRYDRLLEAENSISHLDDFVSACLACWTKRVPFGCYNVTNSGAITTREVTELIRKHRGREQAFKFFKNEAEFMEKAAQTPRSNCVMANQKLLQAGIEIREVNEAVEDALRKWQPE